MTRAGIKLRAGCMAFRIRWVEECERKRDEAIASRDEARELRGIADRARARESESVRNLDEQVADTERVLTHRGFPHPGGGEHLALAVDNALDTYAERLQTFAETVASHLDVDVAARAGRHYPVRPDTELLERVQDARNGERRYDALRHKMIEGLGLHPMATDDALVRAAHERPFGHTRWQSEVIDLVGGGRTDSELLSRLRQIVADGATAQQRCDELQERARRVGSPANGGIVEISFERNSQQYDDGYTLEHDDQHTRQELLTAAGVYLGFLPVTHWPWEASGWGKGGRIRQLAKAGALIAAEIDRLRRVQNRGLIELDEALEEAPATGSDVEAEHLPADEPAVIAQVLAELTATGHDTAGGDVVRAVDAAIDRERSKAQEFLEAVARDVAAPPAHRFGRYVWPTDRDELLRHVAKRHRDGEIGLRAVRDRDRAVQLLADMLSKFAPDAFVAARAELEDLQGVAPSDHDEALAEQVRRAAYDPAMGGDIEPPSGRPVPGYTARGVLSFPDGVDTEPEQHYAEKAIERAREYLISLGYERVVDDHGEDVASMLREIGVMARQSTDAGTLTPSGPGCAACGMGGLVCSVHPDLPPAATTSRPDACPCGAWVRRCPKGCEVLFGDRVLRLLNQAIRPVPGAGRADWADGQPITRNDLADAYESGVRAGRAQTDAEVEQARAVLAPDVDTTGTPLDTLARASIDSNRTLAVAAELRWWAASTLTAPDDTKVQRRADYLDPGGDQPDPNVGAPRPDVWAAARERSDEVPF